MQSDYVKSFGKICDWYCSHWGSTRSLSHRTWAKPITHNDAYNNNNFASHFIFIRLLFGFQRITTNTNEFMHTQRVESTQKSSAYRMKKITWQKKRKRKKKKDCRELDLKTRDSIHKFSAFSCGVAQDFNFPSSEANVSLCNLHIANVEMCVHLCAQGSL